VERNEPASTAGQIGVDAVDTNWTRSGGDSSHDATSTCCDAVNASTLRKTSVAALDGDQLVLPDGGFASRAIVSSISARVHTALPWLINRRFAASWYRLILMSNRAPRSSSVSCRFVMSLTLS